MSAVDEYLAKVDPTQRAELDRVRATIKKVVPEAEEVITYAMPGFKYKGKYLIAYAPFKDHLSVFPGAGAVEELKNELSPFVVSKGTVQFTLENPLPDAILAKLIASRIQEITKK